MLNQPATHTCTACYQTHIQNMVTDNASVREQPLMVHIYGPPTKAFLKHLTLTVT